MLVYDTSCYLARLSDLDARNHEARTTTPGTHDTYYANI
jgi:hypothetical protein